MKVILAVAAVLLAVTHVGDAHGDHSHPRAPYREPFFVIFASSISECGYMHVGA